MYLKRPIYLSVILRINLFDIHATFYVSKVYTNYKTLVVIESISGAYNSDTVSGELLPNFMRLDFLQHTSTNRIIQMDSDGLLTCIPGLIGWRKKQKIKEHERRMIF